MNRPLVPVLLALLLMPTARAQRVDDQLGPTLHAALPASVDELWLVPSERDLAALSEGRYAGLLDAVGRFNAGDHAGALAGTAGKALADSPLGAHAAYYRGLAQLGLSQAAGARATFSGLRAGEPRGYLAFAAALGEAEAAEALGDHSAAAAIYGQLAGNKTVVNDDVLSRLGRAALASGDRAAAAEAYLRVYYDYPVTDAAANALKALDSLADVPARRGPGAELGRAATLFGARRWADARSAYSAIRHEVSGDDRQLVELRLAECDYYLRKYKTAIDALQPLLESRVQGAEARFFHLSALRELGRDDDYVAQVRSLVNDFPDSSWSEEALDDLGTHYILANRDDLAAETFRELHEKFPSGPRGERAAWKYGWWSYKNGEYAETARVFESAALTFPRSNYRPSFLYWAGRSLGKLGEASSAQARLRLTFTDYGSSYYGRLAASQLPRDVRIAALPAVHQRPAAEQVDLPTIHLVRLLLANGFFDDAVNELRYAQRVWGSSPAIEATIAWAYSRKGELRRAISLMRRAYPQHLTAAGEELPTEILQVIFPLTYWDLIRKHAAARELDPYLVAALIAQESTFDPKIRSAANAWGLMQIVPATGRRLAPSAGIRRFRTSMLTDPEINVRIGTLYFSRLQRQFGGTHYALAGYNAGESRVVRWKAERPGLDQDEFIDDIPFPETQNYVKRILGTAEDYRRLYGKGGGGKPIPVPRSTTRAGG
ncbi:MAG TPA: transglycosylase SLT domain-containing protein [Vicinamibacterales bacterium]|nr:transglycosylase SLT domain-containing protein [Vicinamibacterales bacterium]